MRFCSIAKVQPLALWSLAFSAQAGIFSDDVPATLSGDNIDAFSERLIIASKGSKRPIWESKPNDAYVLTLPHYGKDKTVKAIADKLLKLCSSMQGKSYQGEILEKAPVPDYSVEDLTSQYQVSTDDLSKYGNEVGFSESYVMDGYARRYFRPLTIADIPNFWAQNVSVQKMNGFEGVVPYRKQWDELGGICAKAEGEGHLSFSWLFITNELQYSGDGNLFVAMRNEASLYGSERKRVAEYYSYKNKEAVEKSEYEERMRKLAEFKAAADRDLFERDEVMKKEKVMEEQRLAMQRAHATAAFRSKLAQGDESHCGLVVEVREKVAMVQTAIGQIWIKRSEIYPKNFADCRFVNGQYIAP